jgi:hypothetical protein
MDGRRAVLLIAVREVVSMLTAEKYIGEMGVGVTSPQLFTTADGTPYVVKLQYNRMGPKILANELLAVEIGTKLGLCFPQGGVIYLSRDVIQKHSQLRRSGIAPGKQFACRYLPHSYYVNRANLAKAINKQQLAGVMLFDHLLHNVDRTWNRKNLLIRREKEGMKVYAIDNSHLFIRGRWSEATLNKLADSLRVNHRRSYGVLLKHYLKPADFAPYVDAVLGLEESEIEEIVNSIPEEWLPRQEERKALICHIIQRRDLTPVICERLCSLIPNVNRRTNVNKRE